MHNPPYFTMTAVLPPVAHMPVSAPDHLFKPAVLTDYHLSQTGYQPQRPQPYQHLQQGRAADSVPRQGLEPLPASPRGARGPPLAPHAPSEVPPSHYSKQRPPYPTSASSQAPRHIAEGVPYYSSQQHPYSTATTQSGYAPAGKSSKKGEPKCVAM